MLVRSCNIFLVYHHLQSSVTHTPPQHLLLRTSTAGPARGHAIPLRPPLPPLPTAPAKQRLPVRPLCRNPPRPSGMAS